MKLQLAVELRDVRCGDEILVGPELPREVTEVGKLPYGDGEWGLWLAPTPRTEWGYPEYPPTVQFESDRTVLVVLRDV